MTIVHPLAFSSIILSSAACTTSSDLESSALVASSSKQIFGLRTMARAIARRCFCPPLSLTPRSPQYVSSLRGKACRTRETQTARQPEHTGHIVHDLASSPHERALIKSHALAFWHTASTSSVEMRSRAALGTVVGG